MVAYSNPASSVRRPRRAARVSFARRLALLATLFCGILYSGVLRRSDSNSAPEETADLPQAAAVAATRALAGEPPALHGLVTKQGTVHESLWHPRHTEDIKANWTVWMKERRRQEDPPSELSPHVFPGCAVLVNHAYRFIFVRHPKTGSSSVLHRLGLCSEPDAELAHDGTCLEALNGVKLSTMADRSPEDVEKMWRDYFVFTIVRNPLARAVSAYKFVLSATAARNGCTNRMDWDSFCGDPVLAGELCRKRPACCPFGPLFAWSHVIDQARCMTSLDGRLAVDFVATLDTLDADMPLLYAELNKRRVPSLPPLLLDEQVIKVQPSDVPKDTGKCVGVAAAPKAHRAADGPAYFFAVTANFIPVVAKETAYCELRDFYSGQHEHCLASIRQAYGADLRLLYPPQADSVPLQMAGAAAAAGAGDEDGAEGSQAVAAAAIIERRRQRKMG